IVIRTMVTTDVAFLSDSKTCMVAYLKKFAMAGVKQCFDYLEENRADIESHRVATIVDALRASGVDAHRTAPEKDSFSGLYTIDYLLNRASNAIRQRLDPSLVVFELDEFEALQETLGVGAAAFALWEVARLVRPALRRDAVFARHGYDQRFVILIPNGNEESVDTLSERLRKLVSTSVCVYNGQKLSLSIRVGTSESGRLRKKSAIALLAAAADSLDGGAAEAESSVPDARPSSAPPTKPPPSFARPK
ncbi:MAG TPA: GGDEF domain-containing protein, partial [Labilithrix sp.]|nr:GGDEF domain-containing protein [Labilithrix sp.]